MPNEHEQDNGMNNKFVVGGYTPIPQNDVEEKKKTEANGNCNSKILSDPFCLIDWFNSIFVSHPPLFRVQMKRTFFFFSLSNAEWKNTGQKFLHAIERKKSIFQIVTKRFN